MLKEKLEEAIEAKRNDVNGFIWKFARNENGEQESIKLIDASPEQLQSFYDHCNSMLYSNDKKNPGRYPLLEIIKEQRNCCSIELFLRKMKEGAYSNGESYSKYTYREIIGAHINNNRILFPESELDKIPISRITGGLPKEFGKLSIKQVRLGCVDALGIFDNKHLTFSFIVNLGIYLTPEERKEFIEKDKDGNKRSVIEVLKERLNLKPFINLHIKPSGLSYKELRAMLTLRPKKYADLTTDQLTTLRNKVLFRLEQEVNNHIDAWEERIRQIELVAKAKGITLNDQNN